MTIPDYDSIISNIYTNIFLKEVDSSINVFLCGASTQDENSIRGVIYSNIENDSQFNVVFPEWLFGSLLNRKKYNLLELENMLADNVDVIVLPLEGLGTYAELGAFASNAKLRDKIIIINDIKYEHTKSFITEGPVKLISEAKRSNIYYFQDYFNKIDAEKIINKMRYMHSKISKYELDKLFNLARFINYLVAIFQPIQEDKIRSFLIQLNINVKIDLIKPCIEILIKKKIVTKEVRILDGKPVDEYSLSEKGHYYIYEDLLRRLNLVKNFGRMRARVLNFNNRKLNVLNYQEGSKKFLEYKEE